MQQDNFYISGTRKVIGVTLGVIGAALMAFVFLTASV
jgi:hypothetical protein